MLHAVLIVLSGLAIALSLAASAYVLAAFIGIRGFRRLREGRRPPAGFPPMTVLKPVCGFDFELYQNLRSFCVQDYPEYQVIIGVLAADDPAVPVINKIIAELAGRDIALVVDPTVHGTNLKVANLINMFPAVKHDIVVVADSDMRVGPDYLATIAQDFLDPGVGAVTCLYRGVSRNGLLSQLACLHINEWFLPSVLVSGLLQEIRFCFGATMAIRRAILEKAGGFRSLASVLADDYMTGKFAHDQGYGVRLSPYVVDNIVHEPSFAALFNHELRWARTIRSLSPGGYRFLFLVNTISVATIAFAINALTLGIGPVGLAVIALALALRLGLHQVVSADLQVPSPAPFWMIPLRDAMSFVVWVASFLGREVQWRHEQLLLRPDGRIVAIKGEETI